MKAKHYLVHLVRNYPKKKAPNVREEVRKTLSKEQFTAALKKRLLEKRKHDVLLQQLRSLERELISIHSHERERVASLRTHIEELKKKL